MTVALVFRNAHEFALLLAAAGIVQTSTPDEAFLNADVAILVGAMPRREGMERADLLSKNGVIFKVQGVSCCGHVCACVRVCCRVCVIPFPPSIASSRLTCCYLLLAKTH